jgi:hypothetical protein
MADIQELGLRIIHSYLPDLILPSEIRRFWVWYFRLPDVEARYGSTDVPAA